MRDWIELGAKHLLSQNQQVEIWARTQDQFECWSLTRLDRVFSGSGLMERACNFLITSKVNDKCVYRYKYRKKCLIYKVKWTLCGDIYIRNIKKTFKKRTDSHFCDAQRILKNVQNQANLLHITSNTLTLLSHTLIDVTIWCSNQLSSSILLDQWNHSQNLIVIHQWKNFEQSYKCNATKIPYLRKNTEICGACQHKTNFYQFLLSTDDTIIGRKG